jgi:hypothetical protein
MKHYDDDTLLKSVLQLLDESEDRELGDHLAQCSECRMRFDTFTADTGIIGSFVPHVAPTVPPLPRAKHVTLTPLLKVAAILVAGFLAGYLTSELTRPNPVSVVPQNLATKAQSPPVQEYTVCELIDIRMGFN